MNMSINPDNAYHQGLIKFNPTITLNDIQPVNRKLFTRSMKDDSLPHLVDLYYQVQNIRSTIADHSDIDSNDLSTFVNYSSYLQILEDSITNVFKNHNLNTVTGTWSVSQVGVGQAASASLLVLVDISKAPSVSNLWKFAGLDPKHDKWNPLLKNISWKLGKSFEYFSQDADCFYGQLYLNDLNRRINLNEKGAYSTESSEKLPLSRLEAQARRYSVKIFFSHWHHIRYREINGVDPVNTFAESTSYITPPNFPF